MTKTAASPAIKKLNWTATHGNKSTPIKVNAKGGTKGSVGHSKLTAEELAQLGIAEDDMPASGMSVFALDKHGAILLAKVNKDKGKHFVKEEDGEPGVFDHYGFSYKNKDTPDSVAKIHLDKGA